MGIGVLGTLTVDDEPVSLSPRDRVVLSALASRPGQVVSRDTLEEALWREEPPPSAHKVLQGCVVRLRRVVGTEVIQTAPPGYRLVVAEDGLDSLRFERTHTRARDLAAVGQVDRAAHLVDEALGLWRGRPFPDVEDWETTVVEAARLEEMRREAEELRVDCYLRSGRHHEVLADAAALVRKAPTREARWALLARAQYQDGRQAEALATLQRASDLLAERLGIDPGPELGRLRDAMLRQDPELLPDASRRESATCPYRGLAAYDVADSDAFFGRDKDVATCLELLGREGVVAVAGPSGSGKSSVVRAGVAAALTRAGSRVHVVTPGEAPVAVLEALPKRSTKDVLVVDQCEEVFSLGPDEEQRREFLQRLAAHAERAPLVVALRADRLGDVTSYPAFARLVERGLHLLGAMDEQSLREVIQTPARQAGLILEPGLVDLLVREVHGEPGALPLLSHALQETWARREGSTLTVAGYQATGGIRGAVAQTAEQVYGQVDPTQRHLMRELMLRLVSAGAAGEASRIRAPRGRVIVQPAQERLVDELVAARLLTSEEGAIEIAHESLARAWPRLRDWLEEDVQGQRILHHVTTSAEAWDALGRPDSELYRGTRLRQALEWREQTTVELTPVEEEFLDAGRREDEAEERALAERARQQTRLIRRQRIALVAGSLFLVLALAASGIAITQSDRAQAGERTAEAGRIGARALTVENPSLALLLAVEAVRRDDSAQTRGYLREAMARRPELVDATVRPDWYLVGMSVSPTAEEAVGYGRDNVVHRFDLLSGEVLATRDLDGLDGIRQVLFSPGAITHSPDGERVAVGSHLYDTPQLFLLDARTLEPMVEQPRGLPDRPARSPGVAFSADGRWLAASFMFAEDDSPGANVVSEQEIRVWDVQALDEPPTRIALPDLAAGWTRVRLSNDGSRVYTGAPPAAYPVRDDGSKPVWRRDDFVGSGGPPIDLSPDGRFLAASVYDLDADEEAVVVLDTRNGEEVARLPEGFARARMSFSPSGDLLAAAGGDVVRVWRWQGRGGPLHEIVTGVDVVHGFSSDDTLLTAVDGVESWDLAGDRRFVQRRPLPPSGGVEQWWNHVSPEGDLVARHELMTFGAAGVAPFDIALVSAGEPRERRRVSIGPAGIWGAGDWHPEGDLYVAGNLAGEAISIPREGQVIRRRVADDGVTALRHSPDGSYLVVADESGRVTRVEAVGGDPAGRNVELEGLPRAVAVAPDGRRAFLLTSDASKGPNELPPVDGWALVDLQEGEILRTGEIQVGSITTAAAFAPDDSNQVAVFGAVGVLLLDMDTGRRVNELVAAHGDTTDAGHYVGDGSMILAGSTDGRVSMWDADGTLLDVAMIEPEAAVVPRLLPDGHTVRVVTDTAVYDWDTRIESALEAACRAAGRSMTGVEWRTNVGEDVPYRETCP